MNRRVFGLLPILLIPSLLTGQNLAEFEKRIKEFTLPNGLHFIVFERKQAPVVSFYTHVKAGAIDDPKGQTGIAHMFEHMAFKGTPSIGSTNWALEKKALAGVEAVYDKLQNERNKGPRADKAVVAKLEAELKAAIEQANKFVQQNRYAQVIEKSGGVGMNAGTGLEQTVYFYNLPSNKTELWFLLESERFLHPVFREFYKERDVVREELRMRTESSPQGLLIRAFLNTAFASSPYRVGPSGWPEDIESLRATEAEKFYRTYYVPNNLVIGIAGDVDAVQVEKLAAKYFGRLPAGPVPPPVVTRELPQEGPKQVVVYTPAQPLMLIGYKRPSQADKDDAVFDVISDILSSGRTGRLYTEMVRDKKLALAAMAGATFPGGKLENLFVFFLVPNSGHTVEENAAAAYAILEKLKSEKVDAETLQRVKTKIRAGLIRQLDSNSGMAQQLVGAYVDYGNWRKLFTQLDDVNRVTADDVQRVARKYFVEKSRTVGYTQQPPKTDVAGAAPVAAAAAKGEAK
jgi:predicted Zn-dependent peptidase